MLVKFFGWRWAFSKLGEMSCLDCSNRVKKVSEQAVGLKSFPTKFINAKNGRLSI